MAWREKDMLFVVMIEAMTFSVTVAPLSSLQESLSAGRQRNLMFNGRFGLGLAVERKQETIQWLLEMRGVGGFGVDSLDILGRICSQLKIFLLIFFMNIFFLSPHNHDETTLCLQLIKWHLDSNVHENIIWQVIFEAKELQYCSFLHLGCQDWMLLFAV